MNQRAAANVGELMTAEAKVSILQQELIKAKEDINRWKISFSVDVEQNNSGKFDVIVVGKTGEKGFRKIITQDEVMYMFADKHTIVQYLAREYLAELLDEIVFNELSPKLSAAFNNVEKLSERKGFAQ